MGDEVLQLLKLPETEKSGSLSWNLKGYLGTIRSIFPRFVSPTPCSKSSFPQNRTRFYEGTVPTFDIHRDRNVQQSHGTNQCGILVGPRLHYRLPYLSNDLEVRQNKIQLEG